MLSKILVSSRYIVLIAVIGSFLASLASLVIGGVEVVQVIIHAFDNGITDQGIKGIAISFIEVIDIFLIGIVFYIISLGLYELFIDDDLELPAWLVIRNLDDLKAKLISGMIVIMGVYFLGVLENWDGKSNLLPLAGSIALVVGALTFFQFVQHKQHNE